MIERLIFRMMLLPVASIMVIAGGIANGAQQERRPMDLIPGWTDESLEGFVAEDIWPSRHPLLINLVARLRNISASSVERYLVSTADLEIDRELLSDDAWHGYFFDLQGNAISVQQIKLDKELAERVGLDRLLLTTVELASGIKCQVVSDRVPEIWETKPNSLNEFIRCPGLLLKTLDDGRPVFITERLGWFPKQVSQSLGVSDSHVWLSNHGVDLSLLDLLEMKSVQPINRQETELFLQMLSTVSNVDSVTPQALEQQVVGWLEAPPEHVGKFYRIDGHVRRVTRVAVEDPALRQRYDLESYFQLDVFIEHPDLVVNIVDEQGKPVLDNDGYPVTYKGQYSVMVFCDQLPDELKLGNELSQNVNLEVSIGCFYLKTIRHKNFRSRTAQGEYWKDTPMLVGFPPLKAKLIPGPTWPYTLGVVLSSGLLGLFLFYAWRFSRQDQAGRKNSSELPEKIDLDF